MKKIICFVFAACLLIFSGCSILQPNNQADAFYKFNRTGITEITGTAQMTESVKDVVIPKEKIEELLSQLEGLCLEVANEKNDLKGWEYLFTVAYENGNVTGISLAEGRIVIDGCVYRTNLYHSNDFLAYFD